MTTHTGGCHCGKVRYEVDMELASAITCNCSRCHMLGLVLAFAPLSSFRLLSGQDSLTEYRFNKKSIAHLFCAECGVESYARATGPDGTETAAINVRCLDNVDLDTLTITPVDGKSF